MKFPFPIMSLNSIRNQMPTTVPKKKKAYIHLIKYCCVHCPYDKIRAMFLIKYYHCRKNGDYLRDFYLRFLGFRIEVMSISLAKSAWRQYPRLSEFRYFYTLHLPFVVFKLGIFLAYSRLWFSKQDILFTCQSSGIFSVT